MTRREFLAASLAAPAFAAEIQPNILFILADDVGQEVLGCYGGESYQTPRIDELARSGIQFRHCYSMPMCHPSRMALMTGRYPFRWGGPAWGTFPREAEAGTVSNVLRKAGYRTAVAGKWQLTTLGQDLDHPHRLGFDEYSLFGWHEGPRYHKPLIWQNGESRDDVEDRYGPDVYVEFLSDFIRRNRNERFFAYYPMTLCHEVSNDFDEPVPFGPHGRYETYAEMVAAMDECVGRLIDLLDELDLRRKTLVVFVGDNGTPPEYIHTAVEGKFVKRPIRSMVGGKPVTGGKGQLTDAGTRVPLLVSRPGGIAAGQVRDELVDFTDFLPTFAEIAGTSHATVDGQSFADVLGGAASNARSWVFAQHRSGRWIRDQRWKLYDDGRLFDMDRDPAEASPIGDAGMSDEQASARERLGRLAREHTLFEP